MRRRGLLGALVAAPVFAGVSGRSAGVPTAETTPFGSSLRRVRPGDPGWPSAAQWDELWAKSADG